MSILEERYPGYRDKIKYARKSGYSEPEIEKYLVAQGAKQKAPITFTEALGSQFEGSPLEVIGNTFSIPQHLVTAAVPGEGTYSERFAQKIEPSELLGIENPVGAFVTNVVLDPLNAGIGIGAISKLAKAGKLTKAAKIGQLENVVDDVAKTATQTVAKETRPIDDILKILGDDVAKTATTAAPKEASPVDDILKTLEGISNKPNEFNKLGQSSIRKITSIDEALKVDPDLVKMYRGETLSKEVVDNVIRKYDPESLRVIDSALNAGGAILNRKNALDLADDVGSIFQSMAKGEVNPLLSNFMKGKAGAGRALTFERMNNEDVITGMRNYLKEVEKTNPDLAKQLGAQMEADLGKAINKGDINPGFVKKFVEWSTMIKLSGMSTHIRATIGNSASTILRVPEKFAAGTVDALVYGAKRLAGKEAKRSVYVTEALAEAISMPTAFKKATKDLFTMLTHPTAALEEATKAGEVLMRTGAIGRGGKALRPLDVLLQKASGGKFGFNLGEVVRSPGRLIGGVDVFFKEFNRTAELAAQATRQGIKEGKSGTDLIKHISKTVDERPSALMEIANASAKERVFQEELKGFVQTVNQFRARHPMARLVVPFWNTPINLLKQSAQRIPGINLALPSTWKVLRGTNQAAKMELIGRSVSGAAFLTGAFMYAHEGGISALGPKSKSKRATLRLTGWQPQSIKVGDSWVSYRGFEPLSSWLRAAGDVAEGAKEGFNVADDSQRLVFSYMKQFAENPFFMGINDLYEGMNDPEAKAPKVLASLAVGSTVPNILQQWGTRVYDPVVREPKSAWESVKTRLPFGPSKTVKPLRDVFGQEIVRDMPKMAALGFGISLKKGGKVENELARLDIGIGKPTKDINGYEMKDDEYERFYVLKGTMLKQSLERMVNSPGYNQAPDEHKIKTIRNMIRKVNRFVKAQEFEKYYRQGER